MQLGVRFQKKRLIQEKSVERGVIVRDIGFFTLKG